MFLGAVSSVVTPQEPYVLCLQEKLRTDELERPLALGTAKAIGESFVQNVWKMSKRVLGCERGSGLHGGHTGTQETWS